ncbi:type II toxin-antitoxin system VapB family antitoxin [Nocardia alni]|uniref:type II toxin-antitoxin system VapB family antitoxin n=1 Tax=Nocardia alni TaxID=2815723 RepID=UPI001C2193EC|nr:type II toxin-antitoxin system VapB family antitoxin [Nocardia alni]
MALNIKDAETERLAAELAARMGVSKTAAVRTALRDALERLGRPLDRQARGEQFVCFLQTDIWPQIPQDVFRKSVSKAEIEEILGCGPGDV